MAFCRAYELNQSKPDREPWNEFPYQHMWLELYKTDVRESGFRCGTRNEALG